ncbi:hypothetical protein [Serratia marcescens]|uniref:hypothetical protein n=1 Tax=Serratia marcescens TaxID=615 RepID=UPI001F152BE2|nr:hypothetical protein [Serratia marcescens]MDP8728364.1 hypothetical protein [Serratia marcescens]
MAKSKYEIEILGDDSKFNKSASDAMKKLDELSNHTGGFFSGISGGAQKAAGALNALSSMTPGLAALGVAGAAVGAAFMAMNRSIEYVGNLNKISTATGVSVEMLQQLQSEFKATGLEVEKFGDINKDALDHLGDSFRNGKGGIADDLKDWGISLKEFTKYAGDAQGGIKAVIDLFYKMRDAGKSNAEIVNAMESMASDSSHLISTLEQYKSTQEALNAVNSQTASVTNDTAKEFKEFDKNMAELSQNVNNAAVYMGGPLVQSINEVWEWATQDWSNTDFFKNLKALNEKGISPSGMSTGQLANVGTAGTIPYDSKAADKIYQDKVKKFLEANKEAGDKAYKQREAQIAANKKIDEVAAQEAAKAAAKAKAEAEKAAAESKRIHDKMIADRKAAMDKLNALNTMLYSGGAGQIASQNQQSQAALNSLKTLLDGQYISQEQYVAKRKALIDRSGNDFALLLLGADPKQLAELVTGSQQVYDQQLQDLKSKRDKNLIDQQAYNTQLQNLEAQHQQQMDAIKNVNGDLMNSKMAIDMGAGTVEDQMAVQQAQLDQQAMQWLEAQKSMYEAGKIDYEQFLANKAKLDEMYSQKSQSISMMEIQSKMNMYTGFASGMAGIISGIAGDNSKAAKTAFAVSKGLSVAQATINAHEAATKAMAMYPGPMGIAMAATSYASAIGQVMSMKSVQGQFHDGIDDVPNTGTYLLQKGERVVDQRLNEDLKSFLADGQNNQQPMQIDNSISNIKTTMDERQLMKVLKKQQKDLASIVNDANRRNQ